MSTTAEIAPRIAQELQLPQVDVVAAIALFETGATVPFVARYRKEQTSGLDEVQLRQIDEKREYYAELLERRAAILTELTEQGILTPELRARIEAVWVKSVLEDLYLPFKPKRRTRAKIARDRGLLPLAQKILAQPLGAAPLQEAALFAKAGGEVPDAPAALAGARDIVAGFGK
jgi:protein Tex